MCLSRFYKKLHRCFSICFLIFIPSPYGAALQTAAGLKLADVPHTTPMQWFKPNFTKCKLLKDLELIRFWGVSRNNCFHGNTFSHFWVLHLLIKFWEVSGNHCCCVNTFNFLQVLKIFSSLQLKSMHEFSLNLQHRFTFRGSNYIPRRKLGIYWNQSCHATAAAVEMGLCTQ